MRLLLYSQKYAKAIRSMGMNHGRDFDCMTPDCPACSPYREQEREKWQAMSEEQRKKVHFGRIG